ncbi:uncharacterized protein LOC134177316 [Corticium candelabrum]|uniref:uncharacterized protein LOC134177316 n=1 Tax=Corticium candelabrum TaxID=121492 RepID=UPI002E265C20|nr:uncharacterized protein LOC134177316 [Corticium candelabrum]
MHVTVRLVLFLGIFLIGCSACSPERHEDKQVATRAPKRHLLEQMKHVVVGDWSVPVFIKKILLVVVENYGTLNVHISTYNKAKSELRDIGDANVVKNLDVRMIRANNQEYALLEQYVDLAVTRSVLDSARA